MISKPQTQKNWHILVLSMITLILGAGISATAAFARLPSQASGGLSSQPAEYENFPIQTSTPPPACGLAWRTVASPNAAGRSNVLNDIEAVEPGNVWAVGHSGDTALVFGGRTLIQHWNGTQWTIRVKP